jgi:NhaP-type Na+/H+ or K+/H+ antiporter
MEDRVGPRAKRPVAAAALGAVAGVGLLVLCVMFFRAAQGVFSTEQAAQRVIVVVVTLLGAALGLGLLALAAMGLRGRRPAEPASEDAQPQAGP